MTDKSQYQRFTVSVDYTINMFVIVGIAGMKKIAFVVLFLLSSMSYGSGNVHIYHKGTIEKTKLWVITMCGKPSLYVYNYFGRTKIVYLHKAPKNIVKQIRSRFMRLPGAGTQRTITLLRFPCPQNLGVEI